MAAKISIPVLQWHDARPAPVVLVSGPQDYLADRAITALRDVLREEDPALEVSDLDASVVGSGELMTLASPSLFGEPRLIRVSAVDKATDGFLEEAFAYLAAPEPTAYLVLRHRGGVRGKKLLDAVRGGLGSGVEISCVELKRDQDRTDFVVAEFRRAGKRVSGGAIRALAQAFGDDVGALGAACQQLIGDAAGEIDQQLVDRYYGGRVETNAFRVVDAAIAGRLGESLLLLRHAIAGGEDPVPIVAAFGSKLRTMARVSGVRGSGAAIASQLGIAPWMVDRAKRDLQRWDDVSLGRAMQAVADADADVKGAARDPVYTLERLVIAIATRTFPVHVPRRRPL